MQYFWVEGPTWPFSDSLTLPRWLSKWTSSHALDIPTPNGIHRENDKRVWCWEATKKKSTGVLLRDSLGGCVESGAGSLICRARGKSSACASPKRAGENYIPAVIQYHLPCYQYSFSPPPLVLHALYCSHFFFFFLINSKAIFFVL